MKRFKLLSGEIYNFRGHRYMLIAPAGPARSDGDVTRYHQGEFVRVVDDDVPEQPIRIFNYSVFEHEATLVAPINSELSLRLWNRYRSWSQA